MFLLHVRTAQELRHHSLLRSPPPHVSDRYRFVPLLLLLTTASAPAAQGVAEVSGTIEGARCEAVEVGGAADAVAPDGRTGTPRATDDEGANHRGGGDRFERVSPEEAGFSADRLADLAAHLEEAGSSSMLVLHDGRVVFEWGDIYRRHTVHSIRKALLNSLYGIYVGRGVIDTTATLGSLGVGERGPGLTPTERSARVADLLKSRSGIYLPAAAESAGMTGAKPPRGTHAPGEAFHYNNWDFNALGTVFERATGVGVFEAFRDEVARPLGMLQYEGTHATIDGDDPTSEIPDTDGFYQRGAVSRHPAYHFRLSAHDLALYGMLYLDRGRWKGEEVVPADWVEASTRAYSVIDPEFGSGYGLLWNVLVETEERPDPAFFHTGVNVHMLGVYPASRLVVVHRVDTERATDFTPDRLYRALSLLFGARESGSSQRDQREPAP